MKNTQLQLCVVKADAIPQLDEYLAIIVDSELPHIVDAYVIAGNPLHNQFNILRMLQEILQCAIIYEAEPLISGGLDELSKVRQQKDFDKVLSEHANILDSRELSSYMDTIPIMGSNYLHDTRNDVLDLRNFDSGITLVEVFV